MTPACAICGADNASAVTDWDGREVASCENCLEPPKNRGRFWHDEELPIAERAVRFARANPGLSTLEIREALGLDSSTGNAITQGLKRGARLGRLIADEDGGVQRFNRGPASAGGKWR